MPDRDERDESDEARRDREPGRDADTGAEGGEHPDAAPAPFAPHEDDDSPLGDTDQHSDA